MPGLPAGEALVQSIAGATKSMTLCSQTYLRSLLRNVRFAGAIHASINGTYFLPLQARLPEKPMKARKNEQTGAAYTTTTTTTTKKY